MVGMQETSNLRQHFDALTSDELSPLDFLPEGSLEEKIVGLALNGPPTGVSARLSRLFHATLEHLAELETDQLKVVTLGGGTGLSNIVGGDSRREDWQENPFTGLKEIFPGITSIVCVTDDGGSTGELLKYLPVIGLGDLRHVLVSSMRRDKLQELYKLGDHQTHQLATRLHRIFNYRFHSPAVSAGELLRDAGITDALPAELHDYFNQLVTRLFSDIRLKKTLGHPQCMGNLLLASAILGNIDPALTVDELLGKRQQMHEATVNGLQEISHFIGVRKGGVLPCTATPAQLQMIYANGVLVTGESKSAHARRGYPVDRAVVKFYGEPYLPPEVEKVIQEADIIVFAPGSLYSSIIPVLQVPGIAERIRQNDNALKILVGNIWVQKGETDATRDAPERKFHVSDLVRAYHRNIPGGIENLFSHILTLGLGDIPGSVLQNYALEDKEPIYTDRSRLRGIGFEPVEAGIYSTEKLHRRNVIQHDPTALATAVRTLWGMKKEGNLRTQERLSELAVDRNEHYRAGQCLLHPCQRYAKIRNWLENITVQVQSNGSQQLLEEQQRLQLLTDIADILWNHSDILPEHLDYTHGIVLVDPDHWQRCQQWDNIFSFYAPQEERIIIREDQTKTPERFAVAFLVALGQSLLGNYALQKSVSDIHDSNEQVGRIYSLVIRDAEGLSCFFTLEELDLYMQLARMRKSKKNPASYTRLVNSYEGFTPPGLLFGLFYAWYLDNRFAGNIEYKMSIMRNVVSDLIPEQVKIVNRREGLIDFFRENVFRHKNSRLNQ